MVNQNKRCDKEVISIYCLIENDIYKKRRKKEKIQILRKAKGIFDKIDWWYMLTSTMYKNSSFDVQMWPLPLRLGVGGEGIIRDLSGFRLTQWGRDILCPNIYFSSHISQWGEVCYSFYPFFSPRSPACIVKFCSFKPLQKIHILCDCLFSQRNLISL